MAERKRPKGIPEDLWISLYSVGKLDAFESLYNSLINDGFSSVDAVKLATAKLFPQSANAAQELTDPSPESPLPATTGGSPLPTPGKQVLNRDDTRKETAILPDDFHGKKPVSMVKVIEWVFNNLDSADVNKDDCPSAGAWTMLNQCRSDKAFRRRFFESYVPRMMPSNQQMEAINRQRDDGRNLKARMEALIDDFRADPEAYHHIPPEAVGNPTVQ